MQTRSVCRIIAMRMLSAQSHLVDRTNVRYIALNARYDKSLFSCLFGATTDWPVVQRNTCDFNPPAIQLFGRVQVVSDPKLLAGHLVVATSPSSDRDSLGPVATIDGRNDRRRLALSVRTTSGVNCDWKTRRESCGRFRMGGL